MLVGGWQQVWHSSLFSSPVSFQGIRRNRIGLSPEDQLGHADGKSVTPLSAEQSRRGTTDSG